MSLSAGMPEPSGEQRSAGWNGPAFEVPARLLAPSRLSQRVPWLYPLAVRFHRARRRWQWLTSDATWVRRPDDRDRATVTPYVVKGHRSPLVRTLGDADMRLQHNKVVNLRLVAGCLDHVVIRPGETFSFNRVVGDCTRRRGFVDGLRLSNGRPDAGIGGGICQMANLLAWMFMHSDLTILERSEHSFDPFPDNDRVLPWGVGCSIVYNYVDLVVRNDTDATFALIIEVGERDLEGELHSDREPACSYSVAARDEAFWRHAGRVYRRNEIWRTAVDPRTGSTVREELLRRNLARVVYEPAGVTIIDA